MDYEAKPMSKEPRGMTSEELAKYAYDLQLNQPDGDPSSVMAECAAAIVAAIDRLEAATMRQATAVESLISLAGELVDKGQGDGR